MSDELANYLTQIDSSYARISPESLELLGKEAANMFLDEGIALNEAVVKLASGYPDINQDQVKRICEFANTATYLALHDKSKTAGSDSSYPQYHLADPFRVLQDMTDGARPTVVTHTDVEYGKQPLKQKISSIVDTDAVFAELFKTEQGADLSFTKETALQEIMDAKSDLQALQGSLTSSAEQLDLLYKEASDDYYTTVKEHLLDGGSFRDVLAAAAALSTPYEKVATSLQPFVVRLMSERVATAGELNDQLSTLEKVAHRVVNPSHPLVGGMAAIHTLDNEIEKIATGLMTVTDELARVNSFIKVTFGASSR